MYTRQPYFLHLSKARRKETAHFSRSTTPTQPARLYRHVFVISTLLPEELGHHKAQPTNCGSKIGWHKEAYIIRMNFNLRKPCAIDPAQYISQRNRLFEFTSVSTSKLFATPQALLKNVRHTVYSPVTQAICIASKHITTDFHKDAADVNNSHVSNSQRSQDILKNVCHAVYPPVTAATQTRPGVPPGIWHIWLSPLRKL